VVCTDRAGYAGQETLTQFNEGSGLASKQCAVVTPRQAARRLCLRRLEVHLCFRRLAAQH
jgi:hypothetical protein